MTSLRLKVKSNLSLGSIRATVIIEVCVLPFFSVGGILNHRCGPLSFLKNVLTFLPVSQIDANPSLLITLKSKLLTRAVLR